MGEERRTREREVIEEERIRGAASADTRVETTCAIRARTLRAGSGPLHQVLYLSGHIVTAWCCGEGDDRRSAIGRRCGYGECSGGRG